MLMYFLYASYALNSTLVVGFLEILTPILTSILTPKDGYHAAKGLVTENPRETAGRGLKNLLGRRVRLGVVRDIATR